jgi:hypothetical protein
VSALGVIGTQRVRSLVASSPPDLVREAFQMNGSLVGNRCLLGLTSFSTDIGAQLIAILESQPSSPRTPPMLTMAPAASPSLEDCPRARECCGTAVVTPESKEGATVG